MHAIVEVPFDRPATVWPNPPRLPEQLKDGRGHSMKNIFVGNLSFGATEASIRVLFEGYGKVERVNLVTDRDTGRLRGFAFVEMPDSSAADRAIAGLNGRELDGRAMNVNEARPKAQGAGGGFGGRRSGGPSRQRREPRW